MTVSLWVFPFKQTVLTEIKLLLGSALFVITPAFKADSQVYKHTYLNFRICIGKKSSVQRVGESVVTHEFCKIMLLCELHNFSFAYTFAPIKVCDMRY